MTYPFCVASAGGTFGAFHQGHSDYLRLALAVADNVHLVITGDAYAREQKSYDVPPLAARIAQVEAFLEAESATSRVDMLVIGSHDELTRVVVSSKIDVAVVVPSYYRLFRRLSEERVRRGGAEFCILVKPRSREDGVGITSRGALGE